MTSIPYKPENGGFTSSSTAFQSMSAGIMGGTIGYNRYVNPNDPYLQFLGSGTDVIAKNSAFQNIYRGLASQAAPSGSKAGNMWDYVQTLLRSTGFSTGKTATGILDPKDISGLETALAGAIGSNATDVVTYLQAIAASGGRGGTGVKQLDTTTKYNKQVSTSLQLMDLGDATFEFGNAYMTAWGIAPSDSIIKKFQDAWNAEKKAQTPSTTSEQITTYKKVIDPKTGKQLKNAAGQLQWEPVTTSTETSVGKGFTAEEQQAFLAQQLVANFPNENFDEKTIGGAAKAVYDDLVATNRDNYNTNPKFADLLPVIKDIVGAKTAELGQQALLKYKEGVRKDTATKYMSLQEDALNGIDAKKYVGDLLDKLSITLESPVDINDELAIQLLNFQAPDGSYRKANEFEITQAIMKDKRFGMTSAALNEAVNLGQSLKSALGR